MLVFSSDPASSAESLKSIGQIVCFRFRYSPPSRLAQPHYCSCITLRTSAQTRMQPPIIQEVDDEIIFDGSPFMDVGTGPLSFTEALNFNPP